MRKAIATILTFAVFVGDAGQAPREAEYDVRTTVAERTV